MAASQLVTVSIYLFDDRWVQCEAKVVTSRASLEISQQKETIILYMVFDNGALTVWACTKWIV